MDQRLQEYKLAQLEETPSVPKESYNLLDKRQEIALTYLRIGHTRFMYVRVDKVALLLADKITSSHHIMMREKTTCR